MTIAPRPLRGSVGVAPASAPLRSYSYVRPFSKTTGAHRLFVDPTKMSITIARRTKCHRSHPAYPINFGMRDFQSELWMKLTKNRQIAGGNLVVKNSRILLLRETTSEAIGKVSVDASDLDKLFADWLATLA